MIVCGFILLVDETDFLPPEGAVLPNQIALSLRGGVAFTRHSPKRRGCGRGYTATVSQSEVVADQACSCPEDFS